MNIVAEFKILNRGNIPQPQIIPATALQRDLAFSPPFDPSLQVTTVCGLWCLGVTCELRPMVNNEASLIIVTDMEIPLIWGLLLILSGDMGINTYESFGEVGVCAGCL